MDYTYIVTWCLVIQVIGMTYVETDEFDRQIGWNTQHYDQYDCYHTKYFDTKESAAAFILRAENEHDVVNIELDSSEIWPVKYAIDSIFVDSVSWNKIQFDTLKYLIDTFSYINNQ